MKMDIGRVERTPITIDVVAGRPVLKAAFYSFLVVAVSISFFLVGMEIRHSGLGLIFSLLFMWFFLAVYMYGSQRR